ncbi:cytochrome P450 [Absidia repens]|uniref:Cytochrome P450 n=1 Tax=Absidia repens TaxID=90262 RepID=A0A1X2IMB4_9FUNG|nr:cytochrome P450 [Absidia repens]
MSLEGRRWKDHRMVVNPAFRYALPIQLFGQRTSRLFTFLENTYQHDDLNAPFTFDVADMLFRWSLDVLGLALLDFDFETLSKKDDNLWATVYKKVDRDIKSPMFALFPSLDQRYRWLFPKRQAAHDNLETFHRMMSDIINERRIQLKQQQQRQQQQQQQQQQTDTHSRKDLLTLMIESESYGNGRALSDEELLNNLCIFFAAGHETTASALSFALYYLAKHPDIQMKARQEAIDILCEGEEPKMDILPTPLQTKEMRYILQVIKETLRCNGTVASLLQPRVVAKDDTVLMGCHLPKGTPVTVNIYDLHHNPTVWKSPQVFDPSRFGPDGEAELHPHGSIAWMPFGFGTRKCIGYKFNIGEQIVFLSMMLRKYEWSLPVDSIHHEHVITNNIEVMNPINMKITFTRRY